MGAMLEASEFPGTWELASLRLASSSYVGSATSYGRRSTVIRYRVYSILTLLAPQLSLSNLNIMKLHIP